MISRALLVAFATLFLVPQLASAQTPAPPTRRVMTWIAPYAIAASQQQLPRLYNGAGPRNGLSHLALQFWQPTSTGTLRRENAFGAISNAKIAQFVAWGNTNNVKTMLCVFNANATTGHWDWALARSAFFAEPNRTRFINALVAEMQARALDGIDVDLEGIVDATAEEKAAYIAFVRALAARVHALNKEITVDTFPWKWNAPNWTWWPQLFPYVDGITSMGYADLGRAAPDTEPGEPDWRTYAAQKRQAGAYAHKLMIGMPSDVSSWQGSTAAFQVQWFLALAAGDVGIGIWDAQFSAAAWQTPAVWSRLKAVRQDQIGAAATVQ